MILKARRVPVALRLDTVMKTIFLLSLKDRSLPNMGHFRSQKLTSIEKVEKGLLFKTEGLCHKKCPGLVSL